MRDVVEKFALLETAYQSFTRPQWVGRTYSDYDHLARVKEWSAFGGEDDGELDMSALRKPPPPAVIEAQHKASDPAVSAWVSANAGSGKTHVLTERVIRLLLTRNRAGKNPLHHLHQGRRRQHGDARVRHLVGMDRARRCRRSMPAIAALGLTPVGRDPRAGAPALRASRSRRRAA